MDDRAAPITDEMKRDILAANAAMARQALRVLAVAFKVERSVSEDTTPEKIEQDFTFVGLIGMIDPPRIQVKPAIEKARRAGIRTLMITGDYPDTARAIGEAIDLFEPEHQVITGVSMKQMDDQTLQREVMRNDVFARVSPEHKVRIVDALKHNRQIVAMTGDGVNDAPALKKADIGIAMGQRGTQVAREAAAMVLKDDDFRTIVAAVEQGRVIFDNIRKFVLYLLSCNVSELLVVALATAASAPLPILPLQILFLNLVTDVFPALALGVGPGDPDVMRRSPRPAAESILTRNHWIAVTAYGAVITVAVLGAFAAALLWLDVDEPAAVTVSFLTLALAQLWHVFNMRDSHAGLLGNDVVRNPWVWGALLLCLALVAAGVLVPPLAGVLGVVPLEPRAWLLVGGCSLAPLLAGQLALAVLGRRRASDSPRPA